MNEIIFDPTKRHDFLLLFDVADGNPNGDPDAGNMPRIDPETGHGLVTDVCLKRKVRNFVTVAKEGESGFDIFIQEKAILNQRIDAAHDDPEVQKKEKGEKTEEARKFMCRRYFDIRLFGAVMSTGKNAGQVRGPVQTTFGRSIDPIAALDVSITRMAVATEKEALAQSGDNRTMGRKAVLPYALYLARGFFTPTFASQTGVTSEDLRVFWDALQMMWDLDHSAARGMMSCRGLYIFSHENKLGNAPAHTLFDRVGVAKRGEIEAPRKFGDYTVTINDSDLPNGISLTRLIG